MMITRLLPALLLTVLPVAAEPMNVRTLAFRGGEFPKCFLRSGGDYVPLRFSEIQPSVPVKVARENPLRIFQPAAEGAGGQYQVVASVPLPGDARDILLVGMNSGEELRFVAFADNISTASSRDWVLINGTSQPILFQVGEDTRPIGLEPGKAKLEKIESDDEKGAPVRAQAKIDGEVKLIYSTFWPVPADKRSVVLFLEDRGKIRVKRISDSLISGGG